MDFWARSVLQVDASCLINVSSASFHHRLLTSGGRACRMLHSINQQKLQHQQNKERKQFGNNFSLWDDGIQYNISGNKKFLKCSDPLRRLLFSSRSRSAPFSDRWPFRRNFHGAFYFSNFYFILFLLYSTIMYFIFIHSDVNCLVFARATRLDNDRSANWLVIVGVVCNLLHPKVSC